MPLVRRNGQGDLASNFVFNEMINTLCVGGRVADLFPLLPEAKIYEFGVVRSFAGHERADENAEEINTPMMSWCLKP